MAMIHFPRVQRLAQGEIDALLGSVSTTSGSRRLPTLEDREKLPYVKNVVSELMRWTMSAPLGGCLTFWLCG